MGKFIFSLILLVLPASIFASPNISTTTVEYGSQEKFEGFYLTTNSAQKIAPAILMIHNWMGPTEETKTQASRFVELGYNVFIADIYGKGARPTNAKEAGALAGKYKNDRKLFRERLILALETLRKQKNIDSKKIIAVGYCFGGTGALELARSGADIIGVVSFHGGLDSPKPEDGKNIKAKILINHGALDPFVKAEEIAAFEQELNSNKIDYQFIKYAGAVHSFTEKTAGEDISKGAAYNKLADERSFAAAKLFLSEITK